jgi:hypothetical protein
VPGIDLEVHRGEIFAFLGPNRAGKTTTEARADRLRRQWEGSQPWTGSPEDMEDVLGPERTGGLDAVTSGPTQAGLRKNESWGGGPSSPVPAPKPTNGNGNGLSGGAARQVPTGVGGSF